MEKQTEKLDVLEELGVDASVVDHGRLHSDQHHNEHQAPLAREASDIGSKIRVQRLHEAHLCKLRLALLYYQRMGTLLGLASLVAADPGRRGWTGTSSD